jgi:Zn finger protein HypA/HybF involved in hydrogenase expression
MIAPLHTTLEQELHALVRGVSLECLVCGEFLLHEGGSVRCPECGSALSGGLDAAGSQLEFGAQAG